MKAPGGSRLHFVNDCRVAGNLGVAVALDGAPLMRFFKTDDPERIAEDQAAAERLMAITSRIRAARSPDPAEQAPRQLPDFGQDRKTPQ